MSAVAGIALSQRLLMRARAAWQWHYAWVEANQECRDYSFLPQYRSMIYET